MKYRAELTISVQPFEALNRQHAQDYVMDLFEHSIIGEAQRYFEPYVVVQLEEIPPRVDGFEI